MADDVHDDEAAAAELVEPELPRDANDLPPIDFSMFIVSLRTSAMMHLGEGAQGSRDLNLVLARQEIDLLCLLEEKTRGNLSGEEERLLSQILFDLRTKFVAARDRR